MRDPALTLLLLLAAAAWLPAGPALVACAPGYPGTTEDAQPALDAFLRALEEAAGRPAGSRQAVYLNGLEEGLARLRQEDADLALVPLAFYERYGRELDLRPLAAVVETSGAEEVWSLVAEKGRVASPASLDGWEVAAIAGYAPDFVRGAVLGDWGALPGSARIVFQARALSALRRAAAGEDVAVLLDAGQAKALPSLPFGAELEVVHRSRPLPKSLLCSAGGRLAAEEEAALLVVLLRLHESDAGKAALEGIRIARFERTDEGKLPAPGGAAAASSPGGPAVP